MAYIGKVPAVAALTSSDVADGIITNAKLAQDIISADTALGATPADTDEFLVSDAGVLKRMDYSHIKGGASNSFFAYDLGATTAGDLVFTTELYDDGGNYNTSNGRYTAPSAGKYLFLGTAYANQDNAINLMYFKKNGTAVGGGTNGFAFAYSTHFSSQISMIIDLAEDDYIHMTVSNSVYVNNANFTGVKLY